MTSELTVHNSVPTFERRRRTALEEKRTKRKNRTVAAPTPDPSRHLPAATVAEYVCHASDLLATSGRAAGGRRAPEIFGHEAKPKEMTSELAIWSAILDFVL
ncbi:hypothetical protein Bbelb_021350 [Branchiostoma belcheri]|nr:hypothetical protein Bbelb_021350 [Branchiostoma belcheri]